MATQTASPFERLRQSIDREIVTWVGGGDDEPDEVLGVVKSMTERENQHGTYPVVALITEDDEQVDVLGYRTALKNRIYESGIEVGDYFGVRYTGKVTGRSGAEYHAYRVELLGPDGKTKSRKAAFRPGDGLDDDGEPPDLDEQLGFEEPF
jgi:hypothetical protein